MQSTMLKCKLHRARVTQVELEYEGSCAIDSRLLESAGIHEYEQIHIYNVTNGERFVTYAIRAEEGSGTVSVNGGAARRAAPGDIIVICAYTALEQQELMNFRPTLVYLDKNNRITHIKNSIPIQAA